MDVGGAGTHHPRPETPQSLCAHILRRDPRSQEDDGYYISCADIAVTTNGMLPLPTVYANLTNETGNELPINQPRPLSQCVTTRSGSSGGDANPTVIIVVVVVVVVIVLLIGIFVYCYYCRNRSGGSTSSSTKYSDAPPPPPPSGPAGAGQLPPGWSAAVDPASGNTYYAHVSGQTSWDVPTMAGMGAGGVPPPPPGAPPPGQGAEVLPPGWTSAIDPASGRTYYMNTVTNETSWTYPQARV